MINVGGVSWDPDAAFDFTANNATTFQQLDGSLVPSGFGLVTLLNNTGGFCSGCELTFTFDSFSSGVAPSYNAVTDTTSLGFTGGIFKVYVDTSMDGSGVGTLTQGTASNGTLWATFAGHANPVTGLTLTASFDGSNPSLAGLLTGNGFLDVVANGGLATTNLDTNTRKYGSDLAFSSSFNFQVAPTSGFVAAQYGTSSLSGNSIPEPESLALVGLGLLGLAASRRRKSVK
jgi:hypothetical protein